MGKGKTPPGSRKKTTKKHTTAIPVVELLLKKVLNKQSEITKLSLGIIKPKLPPGSHRLKITVKGPKALLLQVRDTNSLQEVWVYTDSAEETTAALTTFAGKKGWGITQ